MAGSYTVFSSTVGDQRLPLYTNAGAPTNGTAGTLAGVAGKGSVLIDTTGATLYQNIGTLASPLWDPSGGALDISVVGNAGPPTNGTSGTFAGVASKGQILVDTTNAVLYMNINTQASPTWTVITPYNSSATLAALGTGVTLGTAAPIVTQIATITAASGSTVGVALPVGVVGDIHYVFNPSAQTIKVFPQAADAIDGGSAGVAVSLSTAKRAMFIYTSANNWTSAQMGVASA